MAKPAIVPNRVSATVTQKDVDDIMKAIDLIKQKLPFLVGLTPEQRQGMLKVGDKSRAFVRKAYDVSTKITGYLPAAFDLAEMRKDMDLTETLYPIMVEFSQLSGKLEDTVAIAGSEGYAAALVVYRNAKDAKGAEGLEDVVDDLALRFARKLGKTAPAEPTTPAVAAAGGEPEKPEKK